MFKRFLALSVLFTLTVSAQVIYFNYSKIGFFATGSWESPDPNVKTEMTETKIDCFREMKTCVLAADLAGYQSISVHSSPGTWNLAVMSADLGSLVCTIPMHLTTLSCQSGFELIPCSSRHL